MVFSSIPFLFYFLPIFLLCYAILPWRNVVLALASLVFYTWGEPKNLPLLLTYIAMNYAFGIWIGYHKDRNQSARLPFAVALIFNLTGLVYFKYFNFLVENIAQILFLFEVKLDKQPPISLPLGISFFVFHAISYLFDIFRGKVIAERSFIALFTYITMFPQLVAGPIVRFSSVARQLHKRQFSWGRAELGVGFFIIGLAQKVLLANTLAVVADQIFELPMEDLSTSVAWLGAVCYTFQIFFDFGGYSLMAIGLGFVCGFSFPRNFNFPYIAQSVTEFWRRWHISLSRWFRDYLYIPMGGNRGSTFRTSFNLFTVFVLCGLWHGANWTFLVWGVYHGIFLVLERQALGVKLAKFVRPIRHLYTLLVIVFSWVIFRSDSISFAGKYICRMFGIDNDSYSTPLAFFLSPSILVALFAGCLFATPIYKSFDRIFEYLRLEPRISNMVKKIMLLALFFLSSISLASGAYNPFIYFRF